jgi:hypothetical protein
LAQVATNGQQAFGGCEVGWGKGDFIGKKKYRHNDAWGSRKNKFAILDVFV